MKKVIETYGTDTKQIIKAIDAVTDEKKENPAFTAKLLQDTLNTEEYKQAFEKEQGKTKEQENAK